MDLPLWVVAVIDVLILASAVLLIRLPRAAAARRRWAKWFTARRVVLLKAVFLLALSCAGLMPLGDQPAWKRWLIYAAAPAFHAAGWYFLWAAAFGRRERVARLASDLLTRYVPPSAVTPALLPMPRRTPRPRTPPTWLTADDRAFLAAVAAAPDDDTPRLVYADWLDERGDPRGPYLRAAVAGKLPPKPPPGVDPVWAAMVSRPPHGILVPGLTFAGGGPPVGPEFLAAIEAKYGHPLPADYAAFLLLHNGGVPSRRGLWPGHDEQYGEVARFYSSDDKLETGEPALLTPAVTQFEGQFFGDTTADDYRDVILVARLDMNADDSHERFFYLGLRLDGSPRLVEFHYHGNTGLMEMLVSDLPLTSFAAYLGGLV
jgi:uncharacterized protein (TIGR02996 family)